MKCYKCGEEIPDDSLFCQYCGEEIEKKPAENKCPNCNSIIPDDSEFCPYCGEKVKSISQTNSLADLTVKRDELNNVYSSKELSTTLDKKEAETKKCRNIKKIIIVAAIVLVILYIPMNYLLADIGAGKVEKAIACNFLFNIFDSSFSNYVDACYYMNTDDYPLAIEKYNQLGDYRKSKKYSTELSYEYGVLMYKQNDFIEAAKYLKDLSYMDSDEIYSNVLEAAYEEAVSLYKEKSFLQAEMLFKLVNDKKSKKYLILIDARSFPYPSISKLKKQLSFADTKSVIMADSYPYAESFLKGTWRTTNGSYYFTMKSDERAHITYNLPWFEFGDYYRIKNGKIELCKDKKNSNNPETRTLFKIKISDWDTIKVYCAKNGKTYTMYRC